MTSLIITPDSPSSPIPLSISVEGASHGKDNLSQYVQGRGVAPITMSPKLQSGLALNLRLDSPVAKAERISQDACRIFGIGQEGDTDGFDEIQCTMLDELPEKSHTELLIDLQKELLSQYSPPQTAESIHRFLSSQDLVLMDTLGGGRFGKVYTLQNMRSGIPDPRLIKIFTKDRANFHGEFSSLETVSPSQKYHFLQGDHLASRLRHPAFARSEVVYAKNGVVSRKPLPGCTVACLLMERGGKPLDKMMDRLTPEQKISVARQLLEAVDHLRSVNMLHGDIKPDAILVEDVGRGEVRIKIIDFGSSKLLVLGDEMSRGQKGTVAYTPPEGLKAEKYGLNYDLWSLGVVLLKLFDGVGLREQDGRGYCQDEWDQQDFDGLEIQNTERTPRVIKYIIRGLLRNTAELRMTPKEALCALNRSLVQSTFSRLLSPSTAWTVTSSRSESRVSTRTFTPSPAEMTVATPSPLFHILQTSPSPPPALIDER